MTITSRLQLAAKMKNAPTWQAPVWQVSPDFASKAIGSPVAVTAGTFLGSPPPAVTYLISIDGAFQSWPYTLVPADAGKTLRVVVVLTNVMGTAFSTALTAVPTTVIAPGQVQGATATNVTSSGMTISFSPPVTGGTPSSYTVGYRVQGAGTWNNQTGAALSVDLSGLADTTNYEIQVVANNAAGSGTAVLFVRATSVAGAGYWPTSDLGSNIPGDKNYGELKAFTNRFLCDNGSVNSYTSLDPVTGYPTSSFGKTLFATTVGAELCPAGNWVFIYTGTAELVLTNAGNGSLTSSTFNSSTGVGQLLWNTVATTAAFAPTFSAGTTSMVVYDPTDGATYLGSTTPAFWKPAWLRAFSAYEYHRFMDVSGVNGDYMAGYTTSAATFKFPVNWGDRITPATYSNNNASYKQGNWPLEWHIDLCVKTNKSGWYNITALASDDYVTQFATLVANTHPAGKWAAFEFGNELWNTSPGICCLTKMQWVGLSEIDGYLPTNIAGATAPTFFTVFAYNKAACGITIDGLGKVIIRMNVPHGIASGNPTHRQIQLKNFVSTALKAQYDTANGAGTAVELTVEDAYRVSYPTTNLGAVAEVDATAVLVAKAGFVSLNAAVELMTCGKTNAQSDVQLNWSHRRQWQVAQLIRAAWAATGRTISECKTILAEQAGGYQNVERITESLYSALGYTTPLKNVFTAVTVGGYLQLGQSTILPSFGMTGKENTPSGADLGAMTTSVLTQLQQMVDLAYAVSSYGALNAWAKGVGLEAWIYEIGLDTYVGGLSTGQLQLDGKVAAQNDPRITTLLRDWIWSLQGLGFSKVGWFSCGTGSFNLTGCFNLANTEAQLDYTTDPSLQGAKFKGLQQSRTPPATAANRPQGWARTTDHTVPCTLSGYDYGGNESITTGGTNVWPSLLSINNVFGYSGQKGGGGFTALTYFVWSETTRTSTLTINGHNTTSSKTITATILGSGVVSNITAAGGTAAAGVNFSPVSVTLQPGANWIYIDGGTTAGNIFLHSVDFS